MRFQNWLLAGLLLMGVGAGLAEEKRSWWDAIQHCRSESKTLLSAKEAKKKSQSKENVPYRWTANYIMGMNHTTKVKSKEDILCGYYILSEAKEADTKNPYSVMRFGSCEEERHYITKERKLISIEKINWARLLETNELCRDMRNCRPSSKGEHENTTYWINKVQMIFKENSTDSKPTNIVWCVALNGSKEDYRNCTDQISFECKRSTKREHDEYSTLLPDGQKKTTEVATTSLNTQNPNSEKREHSRERKRKKGLGQLIILCVCIGCLLTLVIIVIVAFVCYHRRMKNKESNRESSRQPEVDMDNDAEYDYISDREVITIADYYRNPVDAIELGNIETSKYIEPYDSKLITSTKQSNEQGSSDVTDVSTANVKDPGESNIVVHAYDKVIIRPIGEDTTYDATNVYPKKKRVGNTCNPYDTVHVMIEQTEAMQTPIVSVMKDDHEADTVSNAENKMPIDSFIDQSNEVSSTKSPVSSDPLYYKLDPNSDTYK